MILNILYQTDDNYAPIAGVSMTSLLSNNTHIDEINIYMLDNGISSENIEKYKALCADYGRNIEIIDTAPVIEKIKSLGVGKFRNGYTVYLTMFVMEELELKSDRIFKLDADTLITGPLDELGSLDMEGKPVAATYDCTLNSYKEMIELTPDDAYYNAGIILFDRKKWIEKKCLEQIVDHIHNARSKYYLCEQDLMNIVLKGEIAYLPVRYNLNSGFYIFGAEYSYKLYQLEKSAFSPIEEVRAAMKEPVIHHMMGTMTGRPWEKKNRHPVKKEFNSILETSLWSDWEGTEASPSFVVSMQRFLHAILQDNVYMHVHRMMNRSFLKKMNRMTLEDSDVFNPYYMNTKTYGPYEVSGPLNILYQANDYYAPYLGVSLLSLLDNNKHISDINIFIIDDGIDSDNRTKIDDIAASYGRKTTYIETDYYGQLLEEANAPKFRGNYATYFKLFVLDELPDNVKNILYVDSDTIIRGRLDAILGTDMGEGALAMVPAIYHDKYRQSVGISHDDTTYNAGIMFFDLDAWRRNNCRNRLIEWMEKDPGVLNFAPDQSLAIKALQKDIVPLPLKYNFSTLYTLFTYKDITKMFSCHEAYIFDQDNIDSSYRDIAIYHFIELQVGKPWEADSVHPKKFLWEYFFKRSPWRDMPAPKVKLPVILKLQRAAYKIFPKKIYMALYAFAWKYLMQ